MSIGLIIFSAHIEEAAPAPEKREPLESKIVFGFLFEFQFFDIFRSMKCERKNAEENGYILPLTYRLHNFIVFSSFIATTRSRITNNNTLCHEFKYETFRAKTLHRRRRHWLAIMWNLFLYLLPLSCLKDINVAPMNGCVWKRNEVTHEMTLIKVAYMPKCLRSMCGPAEHTFDMFVVFYFSNH